MRFGNCTNRSPSILLVLLLLTILGLQGCSSSLLAYIPYPPYTPYLPYIPYSLGARDWFGYRDYQLDSHTFIVVYSAGAKTRIDRPVEQWIRVAQELVLYRAAELAKQQNATSVHILGKDDFYHVTPDALPPPMLMLEASAVVRIVPQDQPVDHPDVFQVASVFKEAQLTEGFFIPYRDVLSHEAATAAGKAGVDRWRNRTLQQDLSLYTADHLTISNTSPETRIAKMSDGRFKIQTRKDWPFGLISFLNQCVQLTEREGYPLFKLEDWIQDDRFVRATIILLHDQDSNGLNTSFVVKDLKLQVEPESIKRIERIKKEQGIKRDLDAGLIY